MIPTELVEIPQWVVWKYEQRNGGDKPTKPPFNPITGRYASTTDSSTWGSYTQAYEAFQSNQWNGLGFVLTKQDPYTFIDLDKVYDETLINKFNTYTEISPSGKGLHMVVRGSVPKGRKSNEIEIYSDLRYMTVTGKVWPEYRAITEANGSLLELWQGLGKGAEGVGCPQEETEGLESDRAVWDRASGASNGAKFLGLWEGSWQELGYSSQSEADLALVNILGFYSNDIEQVRRLFLYSGLGKRPKATRPDYQKWLLDKSFDRKLPDTTIVNLPPLIRAEMPTEIVKRPFACTFPPGVVGEIAEYIYAQAPKPTIEVALAGALCLMAGICGRGWNVLGNGLNIYLIVIADTGVGKEAANSGISKLAKACINLTCFIGPSKLESGQGLISHLTKYPCHVVLQGEFGLKLKNLSSDRASPTQIRLRDDLLNLYGKSGQGETEWGVARSKAENSSPAIESPSLSILAESSPEIYLESITQESLHYGLLPRFTTLHHKGQAQEAHFNLNPVSIPVALIEKLEALSTYAIKSGISPIKVIQVQLDGEAQRLWGEYEHYNVTNLRKKSQASEMYSRAGMKATKLAALVAVGVNYLYPQITGPIMQWAIDLTTYDTNTVVSWFDKGDTGDPTNETKRMEILYTIIREYYSKGYDNAKVYSVTKEQYDTNWIPQSYLYRRCSKFSAFINHRTGIAASLNEVLQAGVDGGQLRYDGPKVYRAGPRQFAPGPSFPV